VKKRIHAHDFAQRLANLSKEEQFNEINKLNNINKAKILVYLDDELAAEILALFQLEDQIKLVSLMEPDDARDIILELEDEEQQILVDALDGESSKLSQWISYDDRQTGSAMTDRIIVINQNMDVKEATKLVIKEAPNVDYITTLSVVDDNHTFLGTISLKQLLKTKTPALVKTIINETEAVYDDDDLVHTAETMRNYDSYIMPVVDKNKTLLGVVTMDDMIDIFQAEKEEDFEKLAALPQDESKHFFKAALQRLPWLVGLLVLSVPISIVTSFFEAVISVAAILIVFQPLILDTAGDIATQTLAVILKKLTSSNEKMSKNEYREITVGFINGIIIGFVAFIITYVFALLNPSLSSQLSPVEISLLIGLSLWLTVIIAPVIAIIVPVTLRKLKFDPAVASGPFITTFIDIAALVIYFSLAMIFIGGVLG